MFARTTRATISRLLFPVSTLLLLGGPVVARAESSETAPSVAKRHADAMSRGLNHEDARAATYASEQKSIAAKHAAAMDRGLNHEDARVATYAKDVAKERSPAAKHSAAMDRGLNHEDARVASYAQ